MTDTVITVQGLGKRYEIGKLLDNDSKSIFNIVQDTYRSSRRALRSLVSPGSFREEDSHIWALRNVNFEVHRGETLGIIGHNGAGKSTLLKVLTRITSPTEGEVRLKGRVGALLEVGTGFSGMLSGRENVYLNGAILGMTRGEIDRKFDEIVDFAGVEAFIDTPVRHYSSGMYLRLAFAVAAHLEPEILLVDEVLAVGDAAFQKKCLGKMGDVASEGRTVLFVSHDMAAIQSLCSRCILLDHGEKIAEGEPGEIINDYLMVDANVGSIDFSQIQDRRGNGDLRVKAIRCLNEYGIATDVFFSGAPMTFEVDYELINPPKSQRSMVINLGIKNVHSTSMILLSNQFTGHVTTDWPVKGILTCYLPEMPLVAGNYIINIYTEVNDEVADWIVNQAAFTVSKTDYYGTGFYPQAKQAVINVPHRWEIQSLEKKT